MKKIMCIGGMVVVSLLASFPGRAQAKELAQLALNIEKLAQFKQILSDLKKGYEILSGGYNTIKDISKGNFELHKVFLDGLLEVSPAVRKYQRVSDIVSYQLRLVTEYKTAFRGFKNGGWFNANELDYISRVYSRLFDLSVKDLDDLFTVITARKLRMSDDERLAAIDKIYADMEDKLGFLRHFNNTTAVLSVQRAHEQKDVESLQQYYDRK